MRQFVIDKGTPKYYALVKQDNMNGLQERLAGRDATIWVYEMLLEIAQRLLDVLAGLNRHYYSTFQFKRMHRFVAQLDIAPPGFADCLESLFHTDGASAAEQARELTRKIVAQADERMPQVDASRPPALMFSSRRGNCEALSTSCNSRVNASDVETTTMEMLWQYR